jgi:ABC-type multidrug transport system permease subunit
MPRWMIMAWMVVRGLTAAVLLGLAGLIILTVFGVDLGLGIGGSGR